MKSAEGEILKLNRLDVLSRKAEELKQIAAAVRCEELIGKERGMFVDRQEQTRKFASIDEILATQDETWLRTEIERRKAELAQQEKQAEAQEDDPVEGEQRLN